MKNKRQNLWIAPELLAKIKHLAKSENRSISGQIVHMLMQVIGKGKK